MTSRFDCTPSSVSDFSGSSNHQYNTRSSTRRQLVDQRSRSSDAGSLNSFCCNPRHSPESRRKPSPARKSWYKKLMNCCQPSYAGSRVKKAKFNWCRLIEGIFLIGLAACFFSVMVGYSRITQDIDELKSELRKGMTKPQKSKLGKGCKDALQCLRDPTGRADFALQSSGGRIAKIVDTKNYMPARTAYGISVCDGPNGPSSMIQSPAGPGECWAFKGSKGKVIIQLTGSVQIDAVSLEHIPKILSPRGTIDSAPRDFKIYGCDNADGKNENLLGVFQYDADGDPIQTFAVTDNRNYYEYVVFEVLSNHGNPNFTCVYRLRVHGTLMNKLKDNTSS